MQVSHARDLHWTPCQVVDEEDFQSEEATQWGSTVSGAVFGNIVLRPGRR